MKHSPLAALLSLVTLTFGTAHAARAETPLDFAPPVGSESAVAQTATPAADTIAVSFDPPALSGGARKHESKGATIETASAPTPPNSATPTPLASSPPSSPAPSPASTEDIFANGSNSLVAKAVGAAEGTRTPEGHKTPAYHGHSDPGNGVWNLGSFSYQHEAANPEQADEKQLARLATQDETLRQKAAMVGVAEYESDLTVRLNGIDLANQSPMAALAEDGGGYIDRLKQAQEMGLQGSEAVLWARVRSYLDPDTGRWNAPGLGNTIDRISHDQERRMGAISSALEIYNAQVGQVQAVRPTTSQPQVPQDISEQIISQNLQDSDPQPEQIPSQPETTANQIIHQDPVQF